MQERGHRRFAGAAFTAAALLLAGGATAIGAGIVVTASRPAASLTLTPELWLVVGYLAAPLAVALLSVGWSRRPATGARKLVLAGLAADLPAATLLIASFMASQQSWLPFVVVGAFAVVVLLVPSGRCFDAAIALTRGDAAGALRTTRWTAYVIGIPAAIAGGFSAPIALTSLQPCDLCIEGFLAVVVLGAYAVPALVAALLVASARWWCSVRYTDGPAAALPVAPL